MEFNNVLCQTIIFYLGACLGSFVNVLIYRIPIQILTDNVNNINLINTPSHCTKCCNRIKFYYNIPIFGYFLSKCVCSKCKEKISPRYFILEFLFGLIFLLNYLIFDKISTSFYADIFIFFSIPLFFIDFKHFILPNKLIYPFFISGVLINLFGNSVFSTSKLNSILGGVLGYLILISIYKIYFFIRNKEGIGLGDIKLISVIGVWFGASELIYVVTIAAIIGLVYSFYIKYVSKVNNDGLIPFGPFLILSSIPILYIH